MSNVLEKIEEIFASPEKFSPQAMEKLIHETFSFFYELKDKLHSKDEKIREEAMQVASTLKNKLEEQAKVLCESTGMDPSMLENYINEPSHFSEEEWQAIQDAKSEISNLKQELSLNSAPQRPKEKKAKTVKEWIVG